MWEAIIQNRRKARLIFVLMGLLLLVLGAVIGMAVSAYFGASFDSADSRGSVTLEMLLYGGGYGAVGAAIVWLIMTVVAVTRGEKILLATAGGREVTHSDAPQLVNVVEEMAIAANLGTPPRVFILDDPLPNAFAVGRNPEKAVVAVTSGLLRRMNRDELQGVIAHEIGHIKNLDVRFMTYAAVMVASIALISEVFLRSILYTGGSRRRRYSSSSSSRKGGGGGAALALVAVAMVFAALAPVVAHLLYLACSRKREYLADASAARFTRYPQGLASALEKIARPFKRNRMASGGDRSSKTLAPLCTVNPLAGRSRLKGWFSTHPPTEVRVQVLRSMAGGAGYADYEAAYQNVLGQGSHCLGKRTLSEEGSAVQIRQASPPEQKSPGAVGAAGGAAGVLTDPLGMQQSSGAAGEALDILGGLSGLRLIQCTCGMKMKIPEHFEKPVVKCPRCGKQHNPVMAQSLEKKVESDVEESANPKAPFRYQRKGKGWETFHCSCGQALNLSPKFQGRFIRCSKCRKKIEVMEG